jgi:hypothetical protein
MTAPSAGTVRAAPHTVRRLEVAAGASFDDFRRRYEQAAPRLDAERPGFLGAPVPDALTSGAVPARP